MSSLSFSTVDEDLKQLFTPYGDVTSVKIIIDKFTNRSKGFAFVEMPNQEAAEKAIKELNGKHFEGRAIVVNEARPKEDRPSGGGGNKRNFNNSRW